MKYRNQTALWLAFSMLLAQGQMVRAVSPAAQQVETPPIVLPPPPPIENANYDERGVPSKWRWSNEQEWIVDSIGRDVSEVLCFARNPDTQQNVSFETKTVDQKLEKYAYSLTVSKEEEPIQREFLLVDFIWAPENYVPFAEKIIKDFDLSTSTPSAIPQDFIKKVASADMPVLFAENERISKAMTKTPLDPSLHEQAALLQAAIGMIDFSGGFCDTRIPLARISAHLALAKALKHDALCDVGNLAAFTLECLASRDGIANTRAEAMQAASTDPAIKSWCRAISIRSTGDYRIYADNDATELERLEFGLRSGYRASHYNLEFAKKHYQPIPITWLRLLSVSDLAHEVRPLFVSKYIEAEKADYLKAYNAFKHTDRISADEIKGDLNRTATRCLVREGTTATLAPISWDDIAAYHCRHILWAVIIEAHIQEKFEADYRRASQILTEAFRQFGTLNQWPFALRQTRLARIPQNEFFSRIQKEFLEHPEQVTKSNWGHTGDRAYQQSKKVVPPEKFFNPAIPFGTAYWYGDRKTLSNCDPTIDGLMELRGWAPCDEALCRDYAIKKYGKHPSAAQWLEAFGPLANFNQNAMRTIAKASAVDPEQCIGMYKKLAEFDPTEYFNLAEYCQVIGRQDDAVKYCEIGVNKCFDPILVANRSVWLLKHYLSNEMLEKARALASLNYKCNVYNSFTQAALFGEKFGKDELAEKLFKLGRLRYGHRYDLCAFYIRHSANEVFKGPAKELLAEYYPDGMNKVSVADFKGNPQRGIIVTRADWMEPQSPLRENCVIVAVNGIPAEDKEQLALLTRLTDEDSASVIFWNGKGFEETRKKFGFSKDFNLYYSNFRGARSEASRLYKGKPHHVGDESLASIQPENFGANRCGILGIRYDQKRCLTKVTPGMPAHGAGLKVGDEILEVNNVPVADMSFRDMANRIRGLVGTLVTLTVSRGGSKFSCVMKRKHPTSDEELNSD